MLSDQAIEYLTREKWLQALSTYKERNSATSVARGRRKHVRFRMEGWGQVIFEPPDKPGAEGVCPGCQILDVSEEGIALRTSRKIEPGSAVSIELHVSGRIFWLSGRVVYNTGMAGSTRMGVKLGFYAAGNQEKRDNA